MRTAVFILAISVAMCVCSVSGLGKESKEGGCESIVPPNVQESPRGSLQESSENQESAGGSIQNKKTEGQTGGKDAAKNSSKGKSSFTNAKFSRGRQSSLGVREKNRAPLPPGSRMMGARRM
jgi:hypothetical protein